MTQGQFIIFIIVAFIVSRIPIAGKYFKSVNTMFHEDSHGIIAILTGGKIDKIDLFANTEGLAFTETRNRLAAILVTLAGYPGASAFAFLFFYLFKHHEFTYLFYGLLVLVVLNILLWVRNLYGIIWLISFGAILGVLHYFNLHVLRDYFLMFVGSIMLVESIYSAWTILYLSITKPKDAGDATIMFEHTWLSSRLWGVLFFAQSLYFGYEVIKMMFITVH